PPRVCAHGECRTRLRACQRPPAHTASLRRDHALERDRGERISFGDLRLDHGRANDGYRLVGEDRGAFGPGEQVAGKAESAQVVPEGGRGLLELGQAAEVSDLVGGEAEVQEVVDELGESGSQYEVPAFGEASKGQLEGGLLIGLSGLEEAGG